MATIWASWKLALSHYSSSFCSQKKFLPCPYLLTAAVCLFVFLLFFSFPVCNIWMNLVFHALFVLKVGVCFLIGAYFSELCLWFLVGDKMLVSLYHVVCILKCTICQVYLHKLYAPHDVISAAGCS